LCAHRPRLPCRRRGLSSGSKARRTRPRLRSSRAWARPAGAAKLRPASAWRRGAWCGSPRPATPTLAVAHCGRCRCRSGRRRSRHGGLQTAKAGWRHLKVVILATTAGPRGRTRACTRGRTRGPPPSARARRCSPSKSRSSLSAAALPFEARLRSPPPLPPSSRARAVHGAWRQGAAAALTAQRGARGQVEKLPGGARGRSPGDPAPPASPGTGGAWTPRPLAAHDGASACEEAEGITLRLKNLAPEAPAARARIPPWSAPQPLRAGRGQRGQSTRGGAGNENGVNGSQEPPPRARSATPAAGTGAGAARAVSRQSARSAAGFAARPLLYLQGQSGYDRLQFRAGGGMRSRAPTQTLNCLLQQI